MIEILAPCGNADVFFNAINSGADAVYLGLEDFSARKNAENFNQSNIKFFISYAHLFSVKVYVCINTLILTSELEKLYSCVKTAYLAGCDAFIVQDLFLGKRLKEAFPQIVLHLSTQAGVNNIYGAQIAKEFGFSRVVLARETDIKEIKEISKIIETEVFIHGALCTSLSGHCYMSSFIGANSGNRGLCRQPCRKKYTYSFNGKECFALSLADLCLKDKIFELISAGVSSFKIEGRMRSSEYVASAVLLYKALINKKPYDKYYSQVMRSFNRGNYTTGYAFGEDKNLIFEHVQGNLGEFCEKISVIKNDKIYLKNNYKKDSGFKIIRNKTEVGSAIITKDGNVALFNGNVKIGDSIYITKDTSIELPQKKLIDVNITAEFFSGGKAKLCALGQEVESDFILEKAKNQSLEESNLLKNLSKVESFPFSIRLISFKTDGVFVSHSQLNSLRKKLYDKIFYKESERAVASEAFIVPSLTQMKDFRLAVITSSTKLKVDDKVTEIIFAPDEYSQKNLLEFIDNNQYSKAEKYLYIPAFFTESEISCLKQINLKFDGLYIEGIFGYKLATELGLKVFGGIELNIYNKIDIDEIKKLKIEKFALSKELNKKQIDQLDGYVFAFGAIKVMSLEYCPKKRDCKNCNNEKLFTLTDYAGRVFPVRRYKTSNCRFEIFNESIMVASSRFDKTIIDLTAFDDKMQQKLLNDYLLEDVCEKNNLKFTRGYLGK